MNEAPVTLTFSDNWIEAEDIRKLLASIPSVSFTEKKRFFGFLREFTVTGRPGAVQYAALRLRQHAEAEQSSRDAW